MIILRYKTFSEEYKKLVELRKANPQMKNVSAAAQLAQMKQNTANLNAIENATRTARRDVGHQIQDRIASAAQSGNNSQRTRLLNKATNAGVNAGYQKSLEVMKNNNTASINSGAAGIQKVNNSVGILQGAKNTWNNMSQRNKNLLLGAAAIGTVGLLASRRRERERDRY